MSDLSAEDREKAKKLWDHIVQVKADYSGLNMHMMVNEAAKGLHQLMPSDISVTKMLLVSSIKSRQFEEAIALLNLATTPKDDFKFEHAYIFHRLGKNKEALAKMKSIPQAQRGVKYNLLFSQICYKLFDYKGSSEHYEQIL